LTCRGPFYQVLDRDVGQGHLVFRQIAVGASINLQVVQELPIFVKWTAIIRAEVTGTPASPAPTFTLKTSPLLNSEPLWLSLWVMPFSLPPVWLLGNGPKVAVERSSGCASLSGYMLGRLLGAQMPWYRCRSSVNCVRVVGGSVLASRGPRVIGTLIRFTCFGPPQLFE
jgi:hypothetical protein